MPKKKQNTDDEDYNALMPRWAVTIPKETHKFIDVSAARYEMFQGQMITQINYFCNLNEKKFLAYLDNSKPMQDDALEKKYYRIPREVRKDISVKRANAEKGLSEYFYAQLMFCKSNGFFHWLETATP